MDTSDTIGSIDTNTIVLVSFIAITINPSDYRSSVEFEIDGICYKSNYGVDEVNIVKKAGGYSGSITIPDIVTYNGLPYRVVRVNNSAFSDCSELQKVDMSASNIIEIKDYAFAGCTNLQSFTVSNSLTTIGYNAFKECSNLISISLPQSVTSIGMGAFSKCSGLTSVTIPQKISTIEQSLFSGCSSLQNITIPDGVTNIGSYAFQSCKSLTKISIPNSVTNIGEYNQEIKGETNMEIIPVSA